MQLIPITSVRRWSNLAQVRTPSSVSTVCPHCGERVVFALSEIKDDALKLATSATARCPGCNKLVRFWAVRNEKSPKTEEENPSGIFMYPPARNFYPTPEFGADVPERLQQSLKSTIDAFNAHNYPATATCGRRTLEGIFKNLGLRAKSDANLFELIEQAKSDVDLAEPLKKLSHAIRDGGNLGAHFDMERELNDAMARQLIELLEYLISYLFVLPKKIQQLERDIASWKPAKRGL